MKEFLEFITPPLATLSLGLSVYAVWLTRLNRGYDILLQFYNDLKLQDEPKAERIEDIIQPEPEDTDPDELFIRNYNRFRDSEKFESKFNLLCYSVIRRQVRLKDFFNLLGPFLRWRQIDWPKRNRHRIANYSYTTQVIARCIKKGLLPEDGEKSRKRPLYQSLKDAKHWKAGKAALTATFNKTRSPSDEAGPQEQ